MKLQFNKKSVKNLSENANMLNQNKTRQIAGGFSAYGCGPISDPNYSCPNSVNGYTC
ncbi:hypothetical protein N474_09285 [Pseudoalteromonas luteoviolacea CPMOR-2]|uniref:Uncharacterized protein n=1 Tax=Pseudoalteromonas luteoviolacea DSM 6061 TaxID=1365250 RepID=A0A167B1Q8_9GAMM|nr:hypothetical protein [Pseudoalteromonas luteoviolacea]KZN46061.1 hypothetical protein N475_07655 [Pseudoalteromonas luteoviolacea DSM 6061]KZN56802.1 hypothetical protein N474_09285 [Pseudoalteromonas luteoviolacea CPMOR-2]MBE0389816.1 hypothetical protein [Pseudoalteromonas luteoviolacea DSM 6061]